MPFGSGYVDLESQHDAIRSNPVLNAIGSGWVYWKRKLKSHRLTSWLYDVNWRHVLDVFRCVVALYITFLFLYFPDFKLPLFGDIPTKYAILVAIGVIVSPPGVSSVGTAISMACILQIVLIIISFISFLFVKWFNDRGLFLLVEIFVTIWILAFVRAQYPARSGEAYGIGLVIVSTHFMSAVNNDTPEQHAILAWDLIGVFSFSTIVSLLCNVLLFPKFSIPAIKIGVLHNIRELTSCMDMVTSTFMHYTLTLSQDENLLKTLESQLVLCNQKFRALSDSLENLRFEIFVTRFDLDTYDRIWFSCKRLLRHLGSMSASLKLIANISSTETREIAQQFVEGIKPNLEILIEEIRKDLYTILEHLETDVNAGSLLFSLKYPTKANLTHQDEILMESVRSFPADLKDTMQQLPEETESSDTSGSAPGSLLSSPIEGHHEAGFPHEDDPDAIEHKWLQRGASFFEKQNSFGASNESSAHASEATSSNEIGHSSSHPSSSQASSHSSPDHSEAEIHPHHPPTTTTEHSQHHLPPHHPIPHPVINAHIFAASQTGTPTNYRSPVTHEAQVRRAALLNNRRPLTHPNAPQRIPSYVSGVPSTPIIMNYNISTPTESRRSSLFALGENRKSMTNIITTDPNPACSRLSVRHLDRLGGAKGQKVKLANSLRHFDIHHRQMLLNILRKRQVGSAQQQTDEAALEGVMALYYFIFGVREFTKETAILGERMDQIQKHYWLNIPFIGQLINSSTGGGNRRRLKRTNSNSSTCSRASISVGYTDLMMKDLSEENELFSKFKEIYDVVRARDNLRREDVTALHNQIRTPWRRLLYSVVGLFKGNKFRYATKTAIAACLFAVALLLDRTKDVAMTFHAEWAISFVGLVLSPVAGSTTYSVLWRIFGTILGGLWAILTWVLFEDDLLGGSISLLIFSFICFYNQYYFKKYSLMSAVTLANFIIVYFTTISATIHNGVDESDIPIYYLATMRTAVLVVSVLVGLFFTWFVWPYFARTALRVETASMLTDMSVLFAKLGNLLLAQTDSSMDGPRIDEFLALEFRLQSMLMAKRNMLSVAENEPRVKGPFPKETYDKLLSSFQVILDRMLSFRMVAFKETSETFRRHVLPVLQDATQDLVVSILADLYIFSGALLLKKPLPPPTRASEKARRALFDTLKQFGAIEKIVLNGDIHYVFVFFVVNDIVKELNNMRSLLVELFGEQKLE